MAEREEAAEASFWARNAARLEADREPWGVVEAEMVLLAAVREKACLDAILSCLVLRYCSITDNSVQNRR